VIDHLIGSLSFGITDDMPLTTPPKFIRVRVKNFVIMHGYDEENKAIEEAVEQTDYEEKLIAIDRIQSVSDNYILTAYSGNRLIYWEYEGGLRSIANQMVESGLLV
jgi:hypothetical protein